jgi:predicted amidohydrolase YtcJ
MIAVCCALSGQLNAETAETVFINGNIHTGNEHAPHAEAIAVRTGRIVFVGSNADAKTFQKAAARVVDLAGKTVVPGLTDSHCHIFGIGEREMNLNLEGTNTLEDFLARVKERVAKTEHGKWITGRGWIETFWQPPQFPTRSDLDKIAPDNPIFLTRADGHAAIANSAALNMARIDKNMPNPFGGEILKDKQSGEPTGMLLDHAQELMAKHIPKPTDAEREQAFLLGVKREIELGWCQIQNAGSDLADIASIRHAFDAGKVKLRVYNAVYGPGPAITALFREGILVDQHEHRFTQRTIKVVFDGALGSRGAALLEPYADAPETSGYLTQQESDLQPMFEQALERGVQVETHAIGDRANRIILNLYERALKSVPPDKRKIREPRWRVEHAQILNLQDVHSVDATITCDQRFIFRAEPSRERSSRRSVCLAELDQVGSHHPRRIGCASGTRRTDDRVLRSGGTKEYKRIFRRRVAPRASPFARASVEDVYSLARLRRGKLADLTVLSKDIMKVPEPEILTTTCAMTVIGGEIVFEKQP